MWQAKYRCWGAIDELPVSQVEQNLRFQGQYFDAETGLHYNTFRYYDPENGRFITQDPIGLEGGNNLYQYAPSPIGWLDPWGWECIKNKIAGTARERRVGKKLEAQFGKENVLQERYLRGMDGKIFRGSDGTARRVDFVVTRKDGTWSPIEVTSKTADKTSQIMKEAEIRQMGGAFVRNPKTKELIELSDISRIMRVQ